MTNNATMQTNHIYKGDCLEVMRGLPDESIDAVVTDPPYNLVSINKRWSGKNTKKTPAMKTKEGSVWARKAGGFMGKKWDGTGIAFNIKVWQQCLRVIKPGGYLLSFGGTRTYHRMAVAIEDAGFEIRDMLEWIYASGFPKSQNVGKAFDKKMGNERDVVGKEKIDTGMQSGSMHSGRAINIVERDKTKGNSQWEGFGSALKPAHEPIVLARKPLSEKSIVENCIKHGTGALDIAGCRIPTNPEVDDKRLSGKGDWATDKAAKKVYEGGYEGKRISSSEQGRFPADVVVTGDALNDGEITKSTGGWTKRVTNKIYGGGKGTNTGKMFKSHFDSGSKSRFFDLDAWGEKNGIICCPKPSKKERNRGLDKTVSIDIIQLPNKGGNLCDTSLTSSERLVRLLVDMDKSHLKVTEEFGTKNKNVIDWSTGWFGKNLMEKYQKDFQSIILTETQSITPLKIYKWLVFLFTNEYTQDVSLLMENGGSLAENAGDSKELIITISDRMVFTLGANNALLKNRLKISVNEGKNIHNTVKPLKLMSWLITLVSKKGDTILDPFTGSGTTGVACKMLDRKFIGIELEEEYIKIAKSRIEAAKRPEPQLF